MEITSLSNSKIKEALKLWKRSEREETQLFLIEGYRELSRAVQGNVQIEKLFVCPEFFLGVNEESLIEKIRERCSQIYYCTQPVFEKLSYRDRPDGLIAIAKQTPRTLESLKGSFFIVAESIEKPGNLGTILRSADATGVDGVIVCDKCTDLYNPNVVRASVGTLFTVPVVETSGADCYDWLKSQNISILAATPSAKKEYTEVDLKKPVAIVVGTEQYGLTVKWISAADMQVKIPMLGVADSLNVATATTVLLYEVVRQRRS